MDMIDALNYVQEYKLEAEANKLANKVGNIYIACWMLYRNIPQTKENITICKKVVNYNKKKEKEWFDWFINEGWKECQ